MGARGWLGIADPPRADPDGVVAETTLRAELWPRLLAATRALLDRYPPGATVAATDRARWLAVCSAIDRGDAVEALVSLAQLAEDDHGDP
jgi:hypothetical protein